MPGREPCPWLLSQSGFFFLRSGAGGCRSGGQSCSGPRDVGCSVPAWTSARRCVQRLSGCQSLLLAGTSWHHQRLNSPDTLNLCLKYPELCLGKKTLPVENRRGEEMPRTWLGWGVLCRDYSLPGSVQTDTFVHELQSIRGSERLQTCQKSSSPLLLTLSARKSYSVTFPTHCRWILSSKTTKKKLLEK